MMQYVDPDFRRALDQFNDSQGGPSYIEVCWNPRSNRWCVFAIPQDYGTHPLAKNWVTPKMLRPFLDGSGRMGVFLFTWQDEKGDYLPLDGRLFAALRYADSFADKDHYEKTIVQPEIAKKIAQKKELRDIAYGARNYWYGLDKAVSVAGRGNWRRARDMATHH